MDYESRTESEHLRGEHKNIYAQKNCLRCITRVEAIRAASAKHQAELKKLRTTESVDIYPW